MDQIAQILPVVSGDLSLPQLDYAALKAAGYVVPEAEREAAEDYLFDSASSGVLRSRSSGARLDLAGTSPGLTVGGVTLAAGLNGLLCETADLSQITMAVVFQRPAGVSVAAALLGSETGPGPNTGAGLTLTSSGGFNLSVRPGTGDPVISGAVGNAIVPVGAWGFVAGVMNGAQALLYLGASSGPVVAAGTISSRTLGPRIGIGKVRDMGASYDNVALTVHRSIIIPRALSQDELTSLYRRCAVVAARRGITVA